MTLRLSLPLQRAAGEIRIAQPFGTESQTYSAVGLRGHNGLDLATEPGELVLAVDEGEVIEIRYDAGGYGVTVKLAHGWGESRYAHGGPRSVPVAFSLGHAVHAGERVLLASGGHVHIGLRPRPFDLDNGFGGYVDPAPYFGLASVETRPAKKAAPR